LKQSKAINVFEAHTYLTTHICGKLTMVLINTVIIDQEIKLNKVVASFASWSYFNQDIWIRCKYTKNKNANACVCPYL